MSVIKWIGVWLMIVLLPESISTQTSDTYRQDRAVVPICETWTDSGDLIVIQTGECPPINVPDIAGHAVYFREITLSTTGKQIYGPFFLLPTHPVASIRPQSVITADVENSMRATLTREQEDRLIQRVVDALCIRSPILGCGDISREAEKRR